MSIDLLKLIGQIINHQEKDVETVVVSKRHYEELFNNFAELKEDYNKLKEFHKEDLLEKEELEKDLNYVIGLLCGMDNELIKVSCENEELTDLLLDLEEKHEENSAMLLDILKKNYNLKNIVNI